MAGTRRAPTAEVLAAQRFHRGSERRLGDLAEEPPAVLLDHAGSFVVVARVLEWERVPDDAWPPDVGETAFRGFAAVHDLGHGNDCCRMPPRGNPGFDRVLLQHPRAAQYVLD